MDFLSILSIFVLACFVGYYVVWSVTPALAHAADGGDQCDLVGHHRRRADRECGGGGSATSKWLGLLGVVLASVNIFGGFAVTERMLAMYKKKDK
jgi:NAD(P) transhydrogenase subunit alpha